MINPFSSNYSLSRRLLKIVLSLYFLVTLVTTLTHIYLEYASAKDDVRNELAITEQAFTDSLASSLWILDLHQLGISANGITQSPLVTGIEIVDEHGKVVIQQGTIAPNDQSKSSPIFWHEFPLTVDFKGKIRQVGNVRLFSSESIVVNRIKLGVQILIVFAIFKTMVLILLFTIVFNKLLTKPLEKLARDAKSIDVDNLQHSQITVDTEDDNELKTLETALNSMIEKISISVANLDALNKSLEDKVTRRTEALNNAVVQLESDQAKLTQEVATRKEREAELLKGRIALQESLTELKRTQDQLIESEKMASLGSLVAGVAHEINNPVGISLTGITHFQYTLEKVEKLYKDEELEEDQFEKFLDDAKQIAKSIHLSLDRAAKLVSSFKRVAVDQSHEQLRHFNIAEYVDEILISLHNQLRPSKINVEVDCRVPMQVKGYPGAWSQIITNLINNSQIHAFGKGNPGNIKLTFQIRGTDLYFRYTDDGKGMPEEIKEKVFEPFYTTNREQGGSGLGMNIIYNIVTQQMKGSIQVDSTPGEGTSFTIKVPMVLEE